MIRAMQDQMQGYFETGGMYDEAQGQMDHESTARQLSTAFCWPPSQAALITTVEQSISATSSSGPCTVLTVCAPKKPLNSYPHLHHHVPAGKLASNQSHVQVAVLNGMFKGLSACMLDTGANLSIVTEAVPDQHGIEITGPGGSFLAADGREVKILGCIELVL